MSIPIFIPIPIRYVRPLTSYNDQSKVLTNSSSVKESNLAASTCSFCLLRTSISFICFLKAAIGKQVKRLMRQ